MAEKEFAIAIQNLYHTYGSQEAVVNQTKMENVEWGRTADCDGTRDCVLGFILWNCSRHDHIRSLQLQPWFGRHWCLYRIGGDSMSSAKYSSLFSRVWKLEKLPVRQLLGTLTLPIPRPSSYIAGLRGASSGCWGVLEEVRTVGILMSVGCRHRRGTSLPHRSLDEEDCWDSVSAVDR